MRRLKRLLLPIPIPIPILVSAAGCAAGSKGVEARIEKVETEIAAVKVQVEKNTSISAGDIGGGGDSVTAWLYAAIAAGAIFYPVVVRPIRKWREKNGADKERG
jgi:hypothetical protein